MFKKKVHAKVSRSNISIERYTTNVPISRDPLVTPGQISCLDSVQPYKDAVIQTERREGGQRLGGEGEIVTPIELHRFNVTEIDFRVCDKDCPYDPGKCTGIKIKQSEYYDDEVSADELVRRHSGPRQEAPVSA